MRSIVEVKVHCVSWCRWPVRCCSLNKDSLAQSVNTMLNLDSLAWPPLPVREIVNNVQPLMTSSADSGESQRTGSCPVATGTYDVREKPGDGQSSLHSDKQWSVLASTPQGNNRFAALASTDDDANHDDRPFTAVRSQRSIRASAKRLR